MYSRDRYTPPRPHQTYNQPDCHRLALRVYKVHPDKQKIQSRYTQLGKKGYNVLSQLVIMKLTSLTVVCILKYKGALHIFHPKNNSVVKW